MSPRDYSSTRAARACGDGLFAFNVGGKSTDLDVAFDDFQVTNERPRRHRW